MEYTRASVADISQVEALQEKYHVSTIAEEDKKDGFVTTLFTREQFQSLIEEEDGLFIAKDGDKIIAYAMAASWDYWSTWPLFAYMIDDLPKTEYLGLTMSTENSYQYGPICIDKAYRSQGVLEGLFEYHRQVMAKRYPVMLTFINQVNPRSMAAHERIGLDLIKTFEFNNNHYYELGYDMSKPVRR